MAQKTKLLIVDDEQVNLMILEKILADLDVEILSARSGKQALDIAEDHDFAVILLDVMMPGLTGFEVAETLRARQATRHVPIIFITAINKSEEFVFKGYELGAVDYLFKPVEPAVIRGKVSVFVELYNQRRAAETARSEMAKAMKHLERSELALRAGEAKYRTLFEDSADAIMLVDQEKIVDCNDQCKAMFGYPNEQMIGLDLAELFPPVQPNGADSIAQARELIASAIKGERLSFSWQHKRANQELFDSEVSLSSVVVEEKNLVQTLIRDVTERNRMQEVIRASEERYRTVADHTYDMECWVNSEGSMLYVSPSCERLTGYGRERFMEESSLLESLIHEEDRAYWRRYMSDLKHIDAAPFDFRLFRRDGLLRWMSQVSRVVESEKGAPLGIRYSLRDITDRKIMELQLEAQAMHDPLTGLANRTLIYSRVHQALKRNLRRDDYHYALVFVDLDRFKNINDSHGHGFGDQVLIEISNRLLKSVRVLDTVSRFGGDEFLLLLEELSSPGEVVKSVKRVRDALKEPLNIDGREVRTTASYGIALSTKGLTDPNEMIRNAEIAMHRAKEHGGNIYKVFTAKMFERASKLLTMESDLRSGLEKQEFHLEFQPIVDINNSTLRGFESLVRWKHPKRGLVRPGEFIPLAESTGLIVNMGRWILEEACRTMVAWREKTPKARDLMLTVNISGKQFSQPDLVNMVRNTLTQTGMPAENLRLEITETAIMENAEVAVQRLGRLRHMGIRISIDDFGTGYSSLNYLQRFPLDSLKIDLSFVRNMTEGPGNVAIVKTIVQLAHNLELTVIAEGVETEEQRSILAGLGCEYGQGYLFSRPIPVNLAQEMITDGIQGFQE